MGGVAAPVAHATCFVWCQGILGVLQNERRLFQRFLHGQNVRVVDQKRNEGDKCGDIQREQYSATRGERGWLILFVTSFHATARSASPRNTSLAQSAAHSFIHPSSMCGRNQGLLNARRLILQDCQCQPVVIACADIGDLSLSLLQLCLTELDNRTQSQLVP